MFDALFKSKFYSKCKSRLKLIRTRLETIRKKRNAMQKFLKKDIVDLLRSALDYNAYERTEGLLVEQNMSLCYELIAKFATCVSGHVRDLCKKRDCPVECKEAMQSLIYAAARFSDLPELREIRTLFTVKFGNSLEPYISKEFVEKLRQDPPSKETKIQLLHDLAQEFSIEWDSKALEQRLHSTSQLHEEKAKPDPLNDHKNNDVTGRDCEGKKDMSDAYWSSTEDETTTDNSSLDGHRACSSSLGSVSEDDAEIKRPFSYKLVPPPYVKEKLNKSKALPEKESNHELVVPKKPMPRSVRRRPLKPPAEDTILSEKAKQETKVAVEDEEERIMNGLLMHYSKKQQAHGRLNGVEYDKVKGHLVRGISLPPPQETLKNHEIGRPEMLRTASHVHPSLPDYDDLSARLAALRKTTIQPA